MIRRRAPGKPAPRRAVLVDLDGTLLDSKLSIRDTLNTVLAERHLAPFSRDDMDRLIGKPLRDILATRSSDPAAIEAMTHRYRAAYNEVGWVTVDPFPGLLPLLRDLRAQGILLATVTSKGQQETETLLFDLGLGDLFDVVVGDDDVRPLKPHPAPVLEACRLLDVAPADAIMVGDTTFDIGAAVAAGTTAVGVLWGIHDAKTLRDAGANALARTPADLARTLRALLRQTQEPATR
ncbi:MAG: HAD-IA family hydrolase [Candidatus Thermoplasmatota archaeon]